MCLSQFQAPPDRIGFVALHEYIQVVAQLSQSSVTCFVLDAPCLRYCFLVVVLRRYKSQSDLSRLEKPHALRHAVRWLYKQELSQPAVLYQSQCTTEAARPDHQVRPMGTIEVVWSSENEGRNE
ncbi:hypothetical protein FA13DRAFT_549441 [Coprinellus micaceus]|uniref:Uncharacterized protein n=1 Tax=Coprinellus micaceus TaxID=71717 RepID=A0A4Y7T879_COPMI|nr:hypothetical protein FA13DRAFT_549441 [Coprinellus micaceus]